MLATLPHTAFLSLCSRSDPWSNSLDIHHITDDFSNYLGNKWDCDFFLKRERKREGGMNRGRSREREF